MFEEKRILPPLPWERKGGKSNPEAIEEFLKSVTTTEQHTLVEAVLNDIIDTVPMVGEVAGAMRLADAIEKKDDVRALMEAGDLLAGFPPGIGDILDILTPTNALSYLIKKGPSFKR